MNQSEVVSLNNKYLKYKEEDEQVDQIENSDIDEEIEIPDQSPSEEDEMDVDGDETIYENDSLFGFFHHENPVYTVKHNPQQPNMIGSGGGDDKAYIWDINFKGEYKFQFAHHSDTVIEVGFSSDGTMFATAGMDGLLLVYNANTGEILQRYEGPEEITWMKWHPKGNLILVGSTDSNVWLFNVNKPEPMQVFSGHTSSVNVGIFSLSGKNIITGSEDGSLISWNPTSGEPIFRLSNSDNRFHDCAITALAIDYNNRCILSGDISGKIKLTNLEAGNLIGSINLHSDSIESIVFCPVLSIVASASVDNTVQVWDFNTRLKQNTLKHPEVVTKLAFVNNSPMLVTACLDGEVRVWDARSGKLLRSWKGHTGPVMDFTFCGENNVCVSASDDGACLVFKYD